MSNGTAKVYPEGIAEFESLANDSVQKFSDAVHDEIVSQVDGSGLKRYSDSKVAKDILRINALAGIDPFSTVTKVFPFHAGEDTANNAQKASASFNKTGTPASDDTGKTEKNAPRRQFDTDIVKDEKKIIDEMKVQTMYKMIEEITIKTSEGHKILKKLLYLTNEQALMFDEKAVSKLLEELDIGDPKFVIIFEPAVCVLSQMKISNPVKSDSLWEKFKREGRYQSEFNEFDSRITESQVVNFMRNVLLPIAIETQAVILVQAENACFLSATFAMVAASEQERLGARCPFKVIASVHLSDIYQKYVNDNASISHQLLNESRAFQRRGDIIKENIEASWKKISRNPLKLCDIPASASRVIVFENLDENDELNEAGKKEYSFNWGASGQLYNYIIKHLIKKVPSIALSSFSTWGTDEILDRLFNKTPVMLIDSRERAISSQKLLNPTSPCASDVRRPMLELKPIPQIDTQQPLLLKNNKTFATTFASETFSFPTVTTYVTKRFLTF